MIQPISTRAVELAPSPATGLALAARSLLRSLPGLDPGPRTALTRLRVATLEATAYRAALTLLSACSTGHRAIAKTATALFPKGPGKALAEAVSAWEADDLERARRLAREESEEIRRRLAKSPFAAPARAAEDEDLRFLLAQPTALADFFVRPLFGEPLSSELGQSLAAWFAYLQDLGMAVSLERRYRDLVAGSFPEAPVLLALLDAWAGQVERLPSEGVWPLEGWGRPGRSAVAAALAGDEAPVERDPVGRFTALDESLAERDLLGRQSLVEALAAMCADRAQGTPFTLALLGEWGVGKSSVMHLLRRELATERRGRFIPVWLNAWSYENTGNMAAALAQEVVAGLVAGLSGWRKLGLRVRFAIRQHRWRAARAVLRLLLTALLFPTVRWALQGTEPLLQSLLGVGFLAGLAAFVVILRRDLKQLWEHPLAVDLKTFLKLPDYGEHLGFLPVVKEHLRTLCDLRLGNPRQGARRLVCFVDDLDRCRSDTLLQTLEAIRLLMDEKDCIVILGFDPRIALAAIGEHYKALESPDWTRRQIARDYLGKVVQLVLRLDDPHRIHLERFVAEQLFPLPPGESGQASGLTSPEEPEPRTMPMQSGSLLRAAHSGSRPSRASASPAVDFGSEMRHTAQEQALFSRLAAEHRFTNPRLLLRLRNGYRFLRLAEAESGFPPAPLPLLMRSIFWQEFLHQWPREIRLRLDAALLSEALPADLPETASTVLRIVGPPLRKLLGDGEAAFSSYRALSSLASLLVLPHGD